MITLSRFRLIAVGKVRKAWVREGLAMYAKRLPGFQIVEVKDSTPSKEAEAIEAVLLPSEQLVVLTEEGRGFDSQAFASWMGQVGSERVAFAIGGAEGFSPALKSRAFLQLSLSAMTFPHDIARLLLMEQIYRGLTILQGGPYHKA